MGAVAMAYSIRNIHPIRRIKARVKKKKGSKATTPSFQDSIVLRLVSFNRTTEAELIDYMSDKQFSAYVKELIRTDMEKTSRKS